VQITGGSTPYVEIRADPVPGEPETDASYARTSTLKSAADQWNEALTLWPRRGTLEATGSVQFTVMDADQRSGDDLLAQGALTLPPFGVERAQAYVVPLMNGAGEPIAGASLQVTVAVNPLPPPTEQAGALLKFV
jgi:C2 domain